MTAEVRPLSLDLRNDVKPLRRARRMPSTASIRRDLRLLGPNGAGKTTTIGIATTRVESTSGTVIVTGVDVCARPSVAERQTGVATQVNAQTARDRSRST